MTITLVLIAGLALACAFVAGCIVGHRTGRAEGSDSALRWCAHYEASRYGGGGSSGKPKGPETRLTNNSDLRKPVDDATLRKMAAAHMERVMTKEGWSL